MMKVLKNAVFITVAFILIIFSILLIKQHSYYEDGLNFEKKALYVKAIDNYAMTVYMHVPFSAYEKKAIEHLLELSNKFEDNKTLSLYCYERLRSSIYGTRWLFTPHKKILKEIEPKIAKIRANLLIKDGYRKSYPDAYKEMMDIMTKDLAPKPFYALISIAMFFAFMGITILAIVKSSNKTGFSIKSFVLYLPIILIFWVLWLVMLYEA